MSNLKPREDVKPKLEAVGLKMEGNRILGLAKSELPILTEYNKNQFCPGDKVLIQRGKRLIEKVIPKIDADGNPIPEF